LTWAYCEPGFAFSQLRAPTSAHLDFEAACLADSMQGAGKVLAALHHTCLIAVGQHQHSWHLLIKHHRPEVR
jgi:hypothetical protein